MSGGAASVHFNRHLIHTCVIQRGSASADANTGEPIWTYTSTGSFACRYVERQEQIADEGAGFPMREQPRLLLANGVDIREEDRVANITLNRTGGTIETGPLYVEELLKRNSIGPHHIWVKLERIE